MNIKPFLFSLLLVSGTATASPFVVSDPSTNLNVTHCAWYLNSAAKTVVVAPKDSNNRPYCKLDISQVAVGNNRIAAAFVIQDPVWGVMEGPQSTPLDFTRPSAPSAGPGNLRLSIQ